MNNTIPNAQLWIGSSEKLEKQTTTYLQNLWCSQGGCRTCTICAQINKKQFYLLLWLTPEKLYSIESLTPIFETIAFANSTGKPFVIVVEQAELLTTVCANKLLKSLEDPPNDYHFLLLTRQPNAIIATIRSRCTIIHHEQVPTISTQPLLKFFKEQPEDVLVFMQTLDTHFPNEQESVDLVEQLLVYWYTKSLKNPTQTNDARVEILQAALKRPPMPGSNKIFWRNLFMQWHASSTMD